ncbi:MAG: hypothetical protein QME64_13230 [bacterium]|nr:hypothetical protein [bacterium]
MKLDWEHQHSELECRDKKTGEIRYPSLTCQYCGGSGWRNESDGLICNYCIHPEWKPFINAETTIDQIKEEIPETHWDKGLNSMASWLDSLGNQAVYEQALGYLEPFDSKKWLVVYGVNQVGKTSLAVSIVTHQWVRTGIVPEFSSGRKLRLKLIESRDDRIKRQSQIALSDNADNESPDYSYSGEYESDYIKTISEAEVLVFDDLGLEPEKDWIHPRIKELLYYRHDENKTTIITTNLDYDQLGIIYGKGIIARLDSRTNGNQFYITLKLATG